jgi:hypothetical protein
MATSLRLIDDDGWVGVVAPILINGVDIDCRKWKEKKKNKKTHKFNAGQKRGADSKRKQSHR